MIIFLKLFRRFQKLIYNIYIYQWNVRKIDATNNVSWKMGLTFKCTIESDPGTSWGVSWRSKVLKYPATELEWYTKWRSLPGILRDSCTTWNS